MFKASKGWCDKFLKRNKTVFDQHFQLMKMSYQFLEKINVNFKMAVNFTEQYIHEFCVHNFGVEDLKKVSDFTLNFIFNFTDALYVLNAAKISNAKKCESLLRKAASKKQALEEKNAADLRAKKLASAKFSVRVYRKLALYIESDFSKRFVELLNQYLSKNFIPNIQSNPKFTEAIVEEMEKQLSSSLLEKFRDYRKDMKRVNIPVDVDEFVESPRPGSRCKLIPFGSVNGKEAVKKQRDGHKTKKGFSLSKKKGRIGPMKVKSGKKEIMASKATLEKKRAKRVERLGKMVFN